METAEDDIDKMLVCDGNAAAGILNEIFASEMTASPAQCAHCGEQAEIGDLMAFMEGPGLILRCRACENIVMRVVQTPESIYLDLRGAVYIRLNR